MIILLVWLIGAAVIYTVLAFLIGLTGSDYGDLFPWVLIWPIFVIFIPPLLAMYLGRWIRRNFLR
jgi:hypothetical protein